MSVLACLTLLFIVCMFAILGRSSLYVLSGLFINVVLFFIFLQLLHQGRSIYGVTFLYILANSLITLVYVNGWHEKTKAALASMCLFLLIIALLYLPLIDLFTIQGFSHEEFEELSMLDVTIPINFYQLTVSVILIGVSGALIDGSMAIASATHEILTHLPGERSFQRLWRASMNVVYSILNSTVNTLFFAFISSSLALIFVFQDFHVPWHQMINSKMFVTELVVIVLSAISVAWILPFAAFISCYYFLRKKSDA